MKFLALVIAAVLCGCAHVPPPTPTVKDSRTIINIVWSDVFDRPAIAAWDAQIERRWPGRKCLVLFCHGVDEAKPPFLLIPDKPLKVSPAENTVELLHRLWGRDRLVVLVSCNPSHDMIHTQNTAWSPWNVWVNPGGDVRVGLDEKLNLVLKSGAGSIDKFVINESESK